MTGRSCDGCGSELRWVRTAANGRLMPLDPTPNPDGNVEIVNGKAVVHGQPTLDPGERWMPHFVTCPSYDRPAGHLCHARGCQVNTTPKLLMCPRHWRMVPARLRRAVNASYVPGQEISKQPSSDYLRAARAAIDAVAQLEVRR